MGLNECLNRNCEKYRIPTEGSNRWTPGREKKTLTISRINYPDCISCGDQMAHLLLPPGQNKTPGEKSFLSLVRAAAFVNLLEADKWLFVGYSFPEYDHDVISLLKSAQKARKILKKPQPEVHIVSPEAAAVVGRIEASLDLSINAENCTFSELVADLMRATKFSSFPHGGMPFHAGES